LICIINGIGVRNHALYTHVNLKIVKHVKLIQLNAKFVMMDLFHILLQADVLNLLSQIAWDLVWAIITHHNVGIVIMDILSIMTPGKIVKESVNTPIV